MVGIGNGAVEWSRMPTNFRRMRNRKVLEGMVLRSDATAGPVTIGGRLPTRQPLI
jgi:hypothetical protein